MTDGTLMIENIQDKDLGTYECVARSEMGDVKSRRALANTAGQENVYEYKTTPHRSQQRPRFIKMPMDQTLSEGQRLLLNCSASGLPDPVIKWFMNEKPILEDLNTEVRDCDFMK